MDLFDKLKDKYEALWKAVVRPPRDRYDVKNLGPKIFKLKGEIYNRTDFQLKNKRGLTLECSHYEPAYRIDKQLPCVIYLHGNCSSRVESIHAVEFILPLGITLFCFDFSGCGKSEGEYISLGWHERDDVHAVIEYLRRTGTVSNIGLWGRSMGAVTALMYVQRDRSIKALVLDSAFCDLEKLFEELAKYYTELPKLLISGVMPFFKKTIQGKADFDIEDLVPINNVDLIFISALFITGKSDSFVDPHHTKELYARYGGNKKLIIVEGDHNSDRPDHLQKETAQFFCDQLKANKIKKDEALYSFNQYSFPKTEGKYTDVKKDEILYGFNQYNFPKTEDKYPDVKKDEILYGFNQHTFSKTEDKYPNIYQKYY